MSDEDIVVFVLPERLLNEDRRQMVRVQRHADLLRENDDIDADDDSELARLALIRDGYVFDENLE